MNVYKEVIFENYYLHSLFHEVDNYVEVNNLHYFISFGYLETTNEGFKFTLYEKLDENEIENLVDER